MPPPPSAQADLPPEQGDHQDDGEAAEHPQVLDQEEDHLGGGVGRVLGDAVHLWELWGGGRADVQQEIQARCRHHVWVPLSDSRDFNHTGGFSLWF